MKAIKNIYYTSANHPRQSLDVYLPENATGFPTFVFFHGGGLEQGSKDGSHMFIDYATTHGVAVICANYRLYPEAAYPDFIRDAASAVAWAHKHMPEHGGDGRIFVGGSSAGGYLSMMLCFDKKYLAVHKLHPKMIAGFVHMSGQPTTHFNVLRERGLDSRRVIIDEAAPLYHIGNEAEYAPMMFFVSDNDMKNRLEQTMLAVSTLRHFGYDESKFECHVMAGKHCQFEKFVDEDGQSTFGRMLVSFINRH
jgi:hypothetical protein